MKVDGDKVNEHKSKEVVKGMGSAVKTASLSDDGPDKDEARDLDQDVQYSTNPQGKSFPNFNFTNGQFGQ